MLGQEKCFSTLQIIPILKVNWVFILYFIYILSGFVFALQVFFPSLFDWSMDWVAWGRGGGM